MRLQMHVDIGSKWVNTLFVAIRLKILYLLYIAEIQISSTGVHNMLERLKNQKFIIWE